MMALMIPIYLAAAGLVIALEVIFDKRLSLSPELGWLVMHVGIVIGVAIAWLLRPAVPLLGQLPLEALSKTDVMLKPYIEMTINHVMAGGIIGAVCGFPIGCLSKHVVDRGE
jgi:hypothetical protein